MTNLILVLFLSLSLFIPKVMHGQEAVFDDPLSPSPAPQSTANGSSKETAKELGLGVGSVFASILYSPLKVTYAGLGLLTGGLSYVISGGRAQVANNIIYPAVRGNYVITPKHLQGKERVIFVGPLPPQVGPPPPLPPADPAMPN